MKLWDKIDVFRQDIHVLKHCAFQLAIFIVEKVFPIFNNGICYNLPVHLYFGITKLKAENINYRIMKKKIKDFPYSL